MDTASPTARQHIERLDRFVAEEVRPLEHEVEGVERLEPDGRLAPAHVEAKREVNRRSAKAGLYALHLPVDLGGGGLPMVDMFHLQEHVSRRGLTLALDALGHLEGPSPNLRLLPGGVGERYLAPLREGRAWQCVAVTEPQSGGSDLLGMRSTATRTAGGWRLEGHKWLISYAPFAEFAQIYAVTDPDAGSRKLTGFLVEADQPGYRRGRVNRTMIDDGVTGELHCDGVEVADDHVIGEPGDGLHAFLEWINWSRMRRGGHCVGLARHCYELALRHAQTRRVFGAPLARQQTIQFRLADMYMDIAAVRALALQCLAELDEAGPWQLHPPQRSIRNFCMIKLASEEMLFRVSDAAIQVLGGIGLLKETGVEAIFRVARNLRIPGGASELMRANIAKTLL